jgi:polyphosphate glucokinase
MSEPPSKRPEITAPPGVVIGIDVGGTGIKGAAVDTATGELVTKRHKVPTPEGATPRDVMAAVVDMVANIRAKLASLGMQANTTVGVCVPAVVQGGVTLTSGNIDRSWVDLPAKAMLSDALGGPCVLVNDADAAGLAESRLGAAKGAGGVTLVLTLGTGFGSCLLIDGYLAPNTELGHLEFQGYAPGESFVTPKIMQRDGVSLAAWAARLGAYLQHIERLFWPNLIVLGGGVSKISDQFLPFASVRSRTVPAHFRNNAGIVGAALLAADA